MGNKPQRDVAKQEIPSLARQVFEIWFNALVKYEPDALDDVRETAWKAWNTQAERMAHECNHAYLSGVADGLKDWSWIGVKYRLPEKEGDYLVSAAGCEARICQFNGKKFFYMEYDNDWDMVEVSFDPDYWMPLPIGPQVKGLGK